MAAGDTCDCPCPEHGAMCLGCTGRFRHQSSPTAGKTCSTLSKQAGLKQSLTPGDMGTLAQPLQRHLSLCPSTNSPVGKELGHAATLRGTPGKSHHGLALGQSLKETLRDTGSLGTRRRGWPSLSWCSGRGAPSLHPRVQCCYISEPGGDTGDSPVPLERLLHPIQSLGRQ